MVGKSFTARKLSRFLSWQGYRTEIFNAGRYRRRAESKVIGLAESGVQANTRGAEGTRDAAGAGGAGSAGGAGGTRDDSEAGVAGDRDCDTSAAGCGERGASGESADAADAANSTKGVKQSVKGVKESVKRSANILNSMPGQAKSHASFFDQGNTEAAALREGAARAALTDVQRFFEEDEGDCALVRNEL